MSLHDAFDRIDVSITNWMDKYGQLLLRYSLATVFIWFGILKPLGISPANELVRRTVYWLPPETFIPILGWWEVAIGVCLLFRPLLRFAILLLFLQMPGTILPLILLPEVCFTQFPFGLTLEGQYIIKNLTLISAGIVIGGTVRAKPQRNKLM
ncbi:DoxX family protein [Candidatus Poribacteria bacterium]|nr:DoxX family protein [Candidatus Poribacteria bacterium]